MAYFLGLEGSYKGKKYCFKKSISFGNQKDCNIFFPEKEKAEPFKIEVESKRRMYFIRKVPETLSLLINGEKVSEGQLFHGNILCIESFRFLFSALDCQKNLYEYKTPLPIHSFFNSIKESDHLNFLYYASNLFATQFEFQGLFHQMAKFLGQIFSASHVAIFLEEPKCSNFQVFSFPLDSQFEDTTLIYKEISLFQFDLVYKQGQAIYWKSLYSKEFFYFIAAPFVHQKQNLGFILLCFDNAKNSQECDLYLLSGICLQAANSIVNIHKYTERKNFNIRLENLNKITLRLSCLLEKDAICRETIREICNVFACKKSALFFSEQIGKISFQYSIGWKKENFPESLEKKIVDVFQEKRFLFSQNLFESMESGALGSFFILMPVFKAKDSKKQIIAVLYAGDPISNNPFTKQDCEILGIIASQVSIALSNASLYEQATKDYLTNLYLRSYFMERLEDSIQDFSASNVSFSLLMLDLDYFKAINDRYGHLTGDHVLKEIAKILKNSIRENDILARYGGEEFVILLKDTDYSCAFKIAERIRLNIQNFPFPSLENRVTISIGIAEYRPQEAMEDFLLRADKALYMAKSQGRNRVC